MGSENKDSQILESIGSIDDFHGSSKPDELKSSSEFEQLKSSDDSDHKEINKEPIQNSDKDIKENDEEIKDIKHEQPHDEEKKVVESSSSSSVSSSSDRENREDPQFGQVIQEENQVVQEDKKSAFECIKEKFDDGYKGTSKTALVGAVVFSIAILAGAIFSWKKKR
ncbi:hypothetical protein SteCoe_11253 [Stentor coeruleus]|uniref:Uncharacterized protein n=1 Tax=Stentor coeruleus TaxID=5963 RepID=A0A1R2CDM4_9CILI|nr:hypothetical protein SteCoe_11253 [Stentor coeruleus]